MSRDAAPPSPAASVLLVDDRPENLLAFEAVLAPLAEATGARLLRAGGAEEALRHVLQEGDALAVVLLDVMMPGTDGLETARLIRQRARSEHVPIIFVTALDADRRRVTLGYQFGAVDYLTKPLDAEVLKAKVRAFLELHRRRGEEVLQERRRYADEVQALREAALRDEAALVSTVQRIGTALASELDLERIVQLVTDEATALTGAEFGGFYHHTPNAGNGEGMRLRALAGVSRERVAEFGGASAMERFAPTLQGEGVVRSDDITADPRYGRTAPGAALPARSYLAVPVRSRSGQLLGGLFFGHTEAGVFSEREERLVAGIAGWAAVAMDNARLYTAERQARKGAEAAAQAKAEFLATMSHEFRTPLNAIMGYAQLLDMGVLGPATPAQHAHLERLQASARHLLRLIDDVLDVAKVDADRLEVRRDALMSGAAVAAAVTLVQPQATAKGVRLMDLGAGEAGAPFFGDEHRVRQVLVNLLSNAVKFTPSGGAVTVVCGTARDGEAELPSDGRSGGRELAPPNGWTFIRVEDTGPGIAAQVVEQLFEPFVQGDGALTREQGGTGLGLAISRRLSRLMGGDVTVRSQLGSGATFTLWLPAASDAELPIATRRAASSVPRRTPPLGTATVAGTAPDAPLDDRAYTVLHALSVRLASEAETVAERYVTALRADARFPGARDLPAVQLRDHVTPMVGLLASQLMVIGETRGRAPELLGDGGQIQRMMAELHGAQRYRLGWSEEHIERESQLLRVEVERTLAASLDTGAIGRSGGAEAATAVAIDDGAVRAAAQYAAVVTRHVLDQGVGASLRAFRSARSADAP